MTSLKEEVKNLIEKARNLNIAVVGETITDEFVYVNYEGQSMKSICPVFRLEGKEKPQQGGAAAIANHLKDFVKSVTLISNTKGEITKTRYVDITDKKKHLELNTFRTEGFKPVTIKSGKYDAVIVADFGHGFCDGLKIEDGFHLMCQTNSNNFGFNRLSKWKKFKKKSVCLDLREASLQMNKRMHFKQNKDIMNLYNYEMNTEHMFLTLGASGSVYTNGKKLERMISFPSNVVDTIGAGDTFFSFASLASCIGGKDIKKYLRVPALAASLSTTWLANEKSVTKKSLLDYADQAL